MPTEPIMDAMRSFCEQMGMEVSLDTAALYACMEPVFRGEGYRQAGPKTVESILVLLFDAVGDTVLTSGFIRELRRAKPTAYIAVLVRPGVAELWEYCPYINELIRFDDRIFQRDIGAGMRALIPLAEKRLLPRHFDWCLGKIWGWAQQRLATRVTAYLSGARERVDFSSTVFNVYGDFQAKPDLGENLLTKAVVSPPEYIHEAARVFYILETLGWKAQDTHMEVWYGKEDQQIADQLMADTPLNCQLIAIGLGAGTPNRKYPPVLLARALGEMHRRNPALHFILLGGATEQESAAQLKLILAGCVTDLTGQTSLRGTAAAIDHCVLYLGNDTGTLHLAAALGKPVLALFRDPMDKDDFLPGVFSGYHRFAPWQVPFVALRPAAAIGHCREEIVYGGCFADHAHCIATIPPEKIVAAYEAMAEQVLSK